VLNCVIVKHFTMNDVILRRFQKGLERDAEGCLFNPHVREMARRVGHGQDTAAVEAISALRMAAHGLHRRMESWAEAHGLSEGRLQVLFRVRHESQVALGELAEMLNTSPRNVTGLIDHLERDGLVERVPDPKDRRSVQARLTAAGTERIESLWRHAFDNQMKLTEGFSETELTQLRKLCYRLIENLTDEEGGSQ